MEGNSVFGWVEYLIFFGMLGASVLIGVYYGFFKKGNDTVDEYMLGGKKMQIFPICMSLITSFVSGITLLGMPAETYVYGTQLYAINFAVIISVVILNIYYLPVLYKLQLNSIFEGGLKAVVWSDTLQCVFTMASVVAVVVLGLIEVGGVGKVIEESAKGERLELFNLDLGPFKRNTLLSALIGGTITWTAFLGVHPGSYQRFMALPSLKNARIVTIYTCIGLVVVKSIMTPIGLLIYTKYHDCDPIITKKILKPGQLLPFYVINVARKYPGLPGLFLSGVVSAALSTMSTGLNTVAGTIYEDFIAPLLPWKLSEPKANLVMKFNVVILGIITTALVFVVEKLGTILQVAITMNGITNGVSLYLISLGLFIPWANSKGAIAGAIFSIGTASILTIGSQMAIAEGRLRFPGKITSIEGCLNVTSINNQTVFGLPGYGTVVEADDVFWFFKISYLYYGLVGFVVGMVVAVLVSWMTGGQDLKQLNKNLIAIQMRWALPKKDSAETLTLMEDQKIVRDTVK